MKALLTLLAVAAATVATTVTLVEPAAAQWGSYGLSQQQLRQQRGNGWSSGDYFGAPQQPRIQQPSGGGYTPVFSTTRATARAAAPRTSTAESHEQQLAIALA